MLSKTSIVILGMLRKGEMNAYDMLKMIDRMNAGTEEHYLRSV